MDVTAPAMPENAVSDIAPGDGAPTRPKRPSFTRNC